MNAKTRYFTFDAFPKSAFRTWAMNALFHGFPITAEWITLSVLFEASVIEYILIWTFYRGKMRTIIL